MQPSSRRKSNIKGALYCNITIKIHQKGAKNNTLTFNVSTKKTFTVLSNNETASKRPSELKYHER